MINKAFSYIFSRRKLTLNIFPNNVRIWGFRIYYSRVSHNSDHKPPL